MRCSHVVVLLTHVAILLGCAANPGVDAGQAAGRQANLITTEEIQQAASTRNAFDLIRALRPNWLQARGVQSVQRKRTRTAVEVMVYVDGTRTGGPEMLRQILASNVQEARYLGGPEATSRYGTNHSAGAILITLRRG